MQTRHRRNEVLGYALVTTCGSSIDDGAPASAPEAVGRGCPRPSLVHELSQVARAPVPRAPCPVPRAPCPVPRAPCSGRHGLGAQHGVLDHPLLVGLTHGPGAAVDAELAIDVRQVVLDRLLGEPELACHLLVRLASREGTK